MERKEDAAESNLQHVPFPVWSKRRKSTPPGAEREIAGPEIAAGKSL